MMELKKKISEILKMDLSNYAMTEKIAALIEPKGSFGPAGTVEPNHINTPNTTNIPVIERLYFPSESSVEIIDLMDVTFIIPIRIESEDRRKNALVTLNYLCKHFRTNIIILEHDTSPKMPEILNLVLNQDSDTVINYHFLENKEGNEIFHRTKFLNIMLSMVTTPVVVNYDVDVLFDPEVYVECAALITKDCNDLVYPYFWGNSQKQVSYSGRDKLARTLDLGCLSESDWTSCKSEYGHCQFFNTKSYIEGGMENEGFISYAPEDQERGYRFKKLGYKVMWAEAKSLFTVYHLEHSRGINSSSSNPKMDENNALFSKIKEYDVEMLRHYYKNSDYAKKYLPLFK